MATRKPPAETGWIHAISNFVSQAVRALPNSYGDKLNFAADLVAAVTLIYLSREGILPRDQIVFSFFLMLAFVLLCFIGTLVVRIVDKSEPG